MQMTQRTVSVTAQIPSTEVRDESTIISAKADMGRYGRVRSTINLEPNADA